MNDLLSTPVFGSLTVGQIGLFIGVAVVFLTVWPILRFVLRLPGLIFRLGCGVIMLFLAAGLLFMLLYNRTG